MKPNRCTLWDNFIEAGRSTVLEADRINAVPEIFKIIVLRLRENIARID